MKIHIESSDDPSVGIFGCDATVEVDWPAMDGDDEERERVRSIMVNAFNEMFDGLRSVWFEDECRECLGRDGKHNGCCMADPKNWPQEDKGANQ